MERTTVARLQRAIQRRMKTQTSTCTITDSSGRNYLSEKWISFQERFHELRGSVLRLSKPDLHRQNLCQKHVHHFWDGERNFLYSTISFILMLNTEKCIVQKPKISTSLFIILRFSKNYICSIKFGTISEKCIISKMIKSMDHFHFRSQPVYLWRSVRTASLCCPITPISSSITSQISSPLSSRNISCRISSKTFLSFWKIKSIWRLYFKIRFIFTDIIPHYWLKIWLWIYNFYQNCLDAMTIRAISTLEFTLSNGLQRAWNALNVCRECSEKR